MRKYDAPEYTPDEIAWLGYNPRDLDPPDTDEDALATTEPRDERDLSLSRNAHIVAALRGQVTRAGTSYDTRSEAIRDRARAAGENSRIPGDEDGTQTGFIRGGLQAPFHRYAPSGYFADPDDEPLYLGTQDRRTTRRAQGGEDGFGSERKAEYGDHLRKSTRALREYIGGYKRM